MIYALVIYQFQTTFVCIYSICSNLIPLNSTLNFPWKIVQDHHRTWTQFPLLWRLIHLRRAKKNDLQFGWRWKVCYGKCCECSWETTASPNAILLDAAQGVLVVVVICPLSHSLWNICTHKLWILRVAYAFKLCGIIQNINMNLRRDQQGHHEAQGRRREGQQIEIERERDGERKREKRRIAFWPRWVRSRLLVQFQVLPVILDRKLNFQFYIRFFCYHVRPQHPRCLVGVGIGRQLASAAAEDPTQIWPAVCLRVYKINLLAASAQCAPLVCGQGNSKNTRHESRNSKKK